MPKAESAFSRANAIHDSAIGWHFVNKLMGEQLGVDNGAVALLLANEGAEAPGARGAIGGFGRQRHLA